LLSLQRGRASFEHLDAIIFATLKALLCQLFCNSCPA
jgi:hypothetical protein